MLAGCLGVYARHCSLPELTSLLKGGVLNAPSGAWGQRLGQALTLAAIAEHALDRSVLLPQSAAARHPARASFLMLAHSHESPAKDIHTQCTAHECPNIQPWRFCDCTALRQAVKLPGGGLVALMRVGAPWCRLEEVEMLQAVQAAIVQFARDASGPVKLASARGVGALVTGELASGGAASSLLPLMPVLLALLGLDQPSDVQRAGMQVRSSLCTKLATSLVLTLHGCCNAVIQHRDPLRVLACLTAQVLRQIAAADSTVLMYHYSTLVPSVCAIAQQTTGPTKLAAEKTLARVLQLDTGLHAAQEWLASGKAGSLAIGMLTDTTLRRLSRLQITDDDGVV